MPLFAEEGIWVDAGALTRSCLTQLFATMDSGTLLTRWTNYSGDFRGATARSGLFRRRPLVHLSVLGGSRFLLRRRPSPLNARPNSHSSDGLSFKETASRLSLPVSRFRQPRLQVVEQNPRGLPHHRQSAVVQCLLASRGAASLDYRASHVSAYLLRGFRSLMPFVQLVNSVRFDWRGWFGLIREIRCAAFAVPRYRVRS